MDRECRQPDRLELPHLAVRDKPAISARMSEENKQAQKRTEWAEDRTIMDNVRAFSNWMGTGLGAIGLKAVFDAFDPTWAAKLVATIFLGVAIAIFWSARNQACQTFARLSERNIEATPSRNYTRLAATMNFAAVATDVIL
ncbi:MAG: putative membrane protein [Yoonia sp.]|jgi:putative membrane protein